jgi:hypothetical protein
MDFLSLFFQYYVGKMLTDWWFWFIWCSISPCILYIVTAIFVVMISHSHWCNPSHLFTVRWKANMSSDRM